MRRLAIQETGGPADLTSCGTPFGRASLTLSSAAPTSDGGRLYPTPPHDLDEGSTIADGVGCAWRAP